MLPILMFGDNAGVMAKFVELRRVKQDNPRKILLSVTDPLLTVRLYAVCKSHTQQKQTKNRRLIEPARLLRAYGFGVSLFCTGHAIEIVCYKNA
jgi:hypothetical protein